MSQTPVTIIYIEDDYDDFKIFHHALSQLGVNATLVFLQDGYEGIRHLYKCKETDKLPELVITDVNMPRMNGVEVIQEMKKDAVLKTIPVFALSTSLKEQQYFDLIGIRLFKKADNMDQLKKDIGLMLQAIESGDR